MFESNFRQMMYYNGHSDYILDYRQGDVNGDGVRDSVTLVGDRPFGFQSPFASRIALLVQDGATNNYIRIPLKYGAGYNPTVFLGDFTGNGFQDILINIDSGVEEEISYIYTFINNIPSEVFNFEEFNNASKYEVVYKNIYKVNVFSKMLNKKYTIDIEHKGEWYLSKIYECNGKLKDKINGEVLALGKLYAIDVERNRTYELKVINRVIGINNCDTLGFVETILKWNGMKFIPYAQYLALPGE